MKKMILSRLAGLIFGAFLAVFGFLCLNYTNGFGLDHHVEWAAQRGLPGPTYAIFLAGALLVALGAGVAGHALGRPRGPQTGGAA